MIPRSISATALNTAETCMARYKVENIDRAQRGKGGDAAFLGTSVHNALEEYVKMVMLEKTQKADVMLLKMLYIKSFKETFGVIDTDHPMFEEGWEMLSRWFDRADDHFTGATVISAEVKSTFDVTVPDSSGTPVTVPFNYIWDRVDRMDNGAIRVIDYKSQRWAWTADQLRKKPQARLYGLAAQIEYPAAEEIWVDFDFLRHDPAITGVRFTKDDNKNTWLWLKALLKKIVDVPETVDLKDIETINEDCRWCVRKAGCHALTTNALAGGTMGLPLPSLIDRRAMAHMQIQALKNLVDEADRLIESAAREEDEKVLEGEKHVVTFGQKKYRSIDADRAEQIIGEDLFAQFGQRTMLMGDVDELLKKRNKTLTEEQKRDLKSVITQNQGEPYVQTKPK